jgi:transposase
MRARRLVTILGVGDIIGLTFSLKTPDAEGFSNRRNFAAWLGLTPKDQSSGGKERRGAITRAGDPGLRSLLFTGAMAHLREVKRRPEKASKWLSGLMARKTLKQVAVALANKIAPIIWKLLRSSAVYEPRQVGAAAAASAC